MLRKLFNILLDFLGKLAGKKVIYYSKNEHNDFGKTAVKSSFGFWYVGNVLDYSDIAYGIFNNGAVEKSETDLVVKILLQLLKEKSELNFYDIGANTGYYGITAAYLGKGKIKCYSFEPIEECCNCIKESVYLNRLEGVIWPFNFALGDKEERRIMYLAGSGSTFDKNFLGNIKVPERMVEVQRLDEVVEKEKLGKPDFMKIDVESYELEVLCGAEKTIKESLPVIFVEIAYSLKNLGRDFINENYDKTLNFFTDLGYKIFCLEGDRLVKIENVHRRNGVRMFLCLHKVKHSLFIENILN